MADGTGTLLHHLGQLADCSNARGYSCVTARREHGLKSVDVQYPSVAIVLRGHKQIQANGIGLQIAPGDLLLMSRRGRLDVKNSPDANGLYLTVAIPLCNDVLDAARLLWQGPLHDAGQPVACYRADLFADHLQAWAYALQAGHYSEARIALAALTIALCRRGHAGLLLPAPPTTAEQIREQVSANPGRDWQSSDFETALGLSGATLRRRLATEQTRLRDVLLETRLACALDLLYSTDLPIKTIAARVGYHSAGSFARRFADRYGMEPSAIGNTPDPAR